MNLELTVVDTQGASSQKTYTMLKPFPQSRGSFSPRMTLPSAEGLNDYIEF